MRRLVLLAGLLILLGAPPTRAGPLERPVRVRTMLTDGTPVDVWVVSYDQRGVMVRQGRDQTERIAWNDLPADEVIRVNLRLTRSENARHWVAMGTDLQIRGEDAAAEKANRQALRIDPNCGPLIDRSRQQVADVIAERAARQSAAATQPIERAANAPWPPLTPAQSAASVEALREHAEMTRQQISGRLVEYETAYFLFYSDLNEQRSRQWVAMLDEMYERLAELFQLPPGENIFHGKALVYVFDNFENFRRYEREIERVEVEEWMSGRCHGLPNGEVHIAFYAPPNEARFANTIVHEAVHGFAHRYRGQAYLPSWVNEGLAQMIAAELVPNPGRYQTRRARAISELRTRGMGGFFTEPQIETEHYPIAHIFAEFMYQSDPAAYIDFINWLKDGGDWEFSLDQAYGATPDDLVSAFGQSLDIPNLSAD